MVSRSRVVSVACSSTLGLSASRKRRARPWGAPATANSRGFANGWPSGPTLQKKAPPNQLVRRRRKPHSNRKQNRQCNLARTNPIATSKAPSLYGSHRSERVAIASDGKRPAWGAGATEEEARAKCRSATHAKRRADGVWVAWRAYVPGADGGYALTAHTLVCIDVDVKDGKTGAANLQSLVDAYGVLPESLGTATPSGGAHIFFRVPLDVGASVKNGKLGGFDSIDVKACGGYLAEMGPGRGIVAHHPVADLPEAWFCGAPTARPRARPDG